MMNQILPREFKPMPSPTLEVGQTTWWQRLTGRARRLTAPRADWSEFVGAQWADLIMKADVTDDFHAKQGRTTARWTLEAGARQMVVYLKRHYELPWLHGLLAALWPGGDWSPAMQERRNLEWAKAHGLPVPNVVAAGEFLGPWGKLQSFLAIEELTDMLPLHEAIPLACRQLAPATFHRWKAGLVREIARLARFLHNHNFFHKDLYLCHFFIARADIKVVPTWTNRVFMIDFHRLAHHPVTRAFWISKDLGQLLYSSGVEGIQARDRLRFWRAYQGDRRRTFWGRWLRRMVALRGRLYQKHNAKVAAKAAA
jgi:Lipopolysaccharide kinase (Kdo/WaaP) family